MGVWLTFQAVTRASDAFFVVEATGERFVIRVRDAETIRLARENLEGKNQLFPMGDVMRGDGGFNQPWSWHLRPDSVRMVEVAIELCDGQPSYVEENLDAWLAEVGNYCPWGARVIAEGPDAGSQR